MKQLRHFIKDIYSQDRAYIPVKRRAEILYPNNPEKQEYYKSLSRSGRITLSNKEWLAPILKARERERLKMERAGGIKKHMTSRIAPERVPNFTDSWGNPIDPKATLGHKPQLWIEQNRRIYRWIR